MQYLSSSCGKGTLNRLFQRVDGGRLGLLGIFQTLGVTGDFPGGTVIKTPHSQCRGPMFDPWSGN